MLQPLERLDTMCTCMHATQEVYVLGTGYDPVSPDAPEQRVHVTGGLSLYLMMGREFLHMDAAPAGAIVAIAGLGKCVPGDVM